MTKRNSKARDTRYLERFLKCFKCGLSAGTLRVQGDLSGPKKGQNLYYHDDCNRAKTLYERQQFERRTK